MWPYNAAGLPLELHEFVVALPHDVAHMADDPYRSLAALVRKAGGYEKVRAWKDGQGPAGKEPCAYWCHGSYLERWSTQRPAAAPFAWHMHTTSRRNNGLQVSRSSHVLPQTGLQVWVPFSEFRWANWLRGRMSLSEEHPPDAPHVLALAMRHAASADAQALPGYTGAQAPAGS